MPPPPHFISEYASGCFGLADFLFDCWSLGRKKTPTALCRIEAPHVTYIVRDFLEDMSPIRGWRGGGG